jgi:hypothetical protein
MAVDKDWIRQIINGVREEIGRYVTFHTSAMSACPLCTASGYYDSINDNTYYFTCPICNGKYYLPVTTQTEVLARVHWTNAEGITATPGGKFFTGTASITIEDKYYSIAESTQTNEGKVVVDGYSMSITKIIPEGAPETNRYRVVLQNQGGRPE